MSERYSSCKFCRGSGKLRDDECGMCGGTGFSGDALLYQQKQIKNELESNQPKVYQKKKIGDE